MFFPFCSACPLVDPDSVCAKNLSDEAPELPQFVTAAIILAAENLCHSLLDVTDLHGLCLEFGVSFLHFCLHMSPPPLLIARWVHRHSRRMN